MLLVLALAVVAVAADQPFVDTKLGRVYGFDVETESGTPAEVYLGIPFAQPPVGELRFEKPVPIEPWEKPINGTQFGHECIPHTRRATIFENDEDCLTLNVIKPKKEAPAGGFPILIWVHGGGYEIGSAHLYGYQGFADAFAHRDVIIVTVQYRIGVYGWFSTGDNDMPGNYGLFDLALGLKFLNDHIGSFGGDNSKITVWGLSAGGAAVNQLAMSPVTRDYVYASVEQSGSAWAHWANGKFVPHYSSILGKQLGCIENIKQCMKSKTVDEIDAAVEATGINTNDLRMIKFGPRIDGDFLTGTADEMAKTAPPKAVISGVSDKDAGFFATMGRSPFIHNVEIPLNDWKNFDKDALKKKCRIYCTQSGDFGDATDEAVDFMTEYYVRKDGHENDEGFYVGRHSDIIGDSLFNIPMMNSIKARYPLGWDIYAYQFTQYHPAIWDKYSAPAAVRGSVHINEFTYMFDMFGLGVYNYTDGDLIVRENIRHALATFAHTGKPVWNGIEWPKVTDELEYIVMQAKPELRKHYYQTVEEFYNKLSEFGYDLISQSHTEKIIRDEL